MRGAQRVSAAEGKPTRVLVTVDNTASRPLSGEIRFPAGFRAVPVAGTKPDVQGLQPGGHYEGEFEITAPAPLDRNRTFHAVLNYRLDDGRTGSSTSYPVSSAARTSVSRGGG